MVQLIAGNKGKGKTKHLLDKVNAEVKTASGNITYLDKSAKHMFELNNKVRLINVSDYFITNSDEFLGFICGILSQDHDLQQMYFDSFFRRQRYQPSNNKIGKYRRCIWGRFHFKYFVRRKWAAGRYEIKNCCISLKISNMSVLRYYIQLESLR